MSENSSNPQEGTVLLSTRPPLIQSLINALHGVGLIVTGLLAALAYESLLPPSLAVYVGVSTLILKGLLEGIIAIGDMWDDGVRNNSFELGRKIAPLLAFALLPLGLLPACVSSSTSDRGLAVAEAAYEVAEIALFAAEVKLAAVRVDPAAGLLEGLIAQRVYDLASARLAKAKAALEAERARREQAALTGGKTAQTIIP